MDNGREEIVEKGKGEKGSGDLTLSSSPAMAVAVAVAVMTRGGPSPFGTSDRHFGDENPPCPIRLASMTILRSCTLLYCGTLTHTTVTISCLLLVWAISWLLAY